MWKGRREKRRLLAVPVRIASQQPPLIEELVSTENVSTHGARLLTQRLWRPGLAVQINSLRSDLRSRARIVYCETSATGNYAVGVELIEPTGKWVQRYRSL